MVTALTHSTEVQALELDRVAFEVVQRPVRSARHEERKESLTVLAAPMPRAVDWTLW